MQKCILACFNADKLEAHVYIISMQHTVPYTYHYLSDDGPIYHLPNFPPLLSNIGMNHQIQYVDTALRIILQCNDFVLDVSYSKTPLCFQSLIWKRWSF